jgi:hypothetical protein
MASRERKTIAIIGATGNQGGSVAHTFLSIPNWHVRCITRNPSSAAALALKSSGAEIVQADLSEPASLVGAFADSHVIFINTDFWSAYRAAVADPSQAPSASQIAFDYEVQCGQNAVEAAAAVPNLERLVYSALPSAKKFSKGKYPHSYHWDSKATIVDYIEESQPDLAKKTSFIYVGAYNTNPFLNPRLDPVTGSYLFILPMKESTRMPIIDPKISTGPFVHTLVENEKPGVKLLAYDSESYLSMREIVTLWSLITGKDGKFVSMSIGEMHEKLGLPLEVLEGPGMIDEFGYAGSVKGVIEPGGLMTEVKTVSFKKWMESRDLKEILG